MSARDPIRVTIPAALAELIPDYLQRRRAELVALQQAREAGDFVLIQRLAHSLKGTGASYGFARLTELGRALEQAAEQADQAAVTDYLRELSDYLTRVEPVTAPN